MSKISRRTFLGEAAVFGCTAGVISNGARTWAASRERPRLDRTNLLVYRARDGEVHPVRSVDDWQKRRAEIVRGMEEIMGSFPGEEKRCALEPKIEEEVDCGPYMRRLVSYVSEPDSRVPAYLCVPKEALEGKAAKGILCLHPTDNVNGHKVVVGLGGKANREYGQELAERGYVTFAPAYPLLANYQPEWEKLGYQSGTMKAIWDNVRALDYLETLPFVKKRRFGAIGHSLGGHNAVYTGVFEERIKAVASSCGLDSFLDYYSENPAVWELGKGWTSRRYMPRLADYAGRLEEIPFDFHEVIGALAPRACFISAPINDSNFKWKSVAGLTKAAEEVYELYRAPNALRVVHPDCGHDFPAQVREEAYAFFDGVFRRA